uniref:Uncharacterized protein n=1 Tax=Phlebotomus papatasi TaxID=29031 RepID=A0A1B0DD38_PHLPP
MYYMFSAQAYSPQPADGESTTRPVVHSQIDRFCKILIVTTATAASITGLYSTASSVLNKLDALDVKSRDPWIIYFLLSKLDQETKGLWAQESANKMPTCNDFMSFLDKRVRALRLCQTMPNKPPDNPPKSGSSKSSYHHQPKSNNSKSNQATVLATATSNLCPACSKADHKVFKCPTFLNMSAPDRLTFVRQKNLCRKCLISTHPTRDCTSNTSRTTPTPSIIPATPATSLQVASIVQETQSTGPCTANSATNSTTPITLANASAINSISGISYIPKKVFLETAIVHVLDRNGDRSVPSTFRLRCSG